MREVLERLYNEAIKDIKEIKSDVQDQIDNGLEFDTNDILYYVQEINRLRGLLEVFQNLEKGSVDGLYSELLDIEFDVKGYSL